MNKIEAKIIIQATFNKPFNIFQFSKFIGEILKSYDYKRILKNNIENSFSQFIKEYEIFGEYLDPDGKKISVLIVHLQKDTSLERARTAQRNFIAEYLRDKEIEAALVAFIPPVSTDWRFSLIKMDYELEIVNDKLKGIETLTPAKRWSFLVGTNERTHTAQSRFLELLINEAKPSLKDIENSFDIEIVTKEFFEKYKELFFNLKEKIDEEIEVNQELKVEFDLKEISSADFAKKTLGQIVFLYFLQKKGWFGVAPKKEWGTGPKNFMRELFQRREKYGENFFNDVLEPLFYEALASDRGKESLYRRLNNCRMPFLNGGLFEPMNGYSWETVLINLPDSIFSNKLETKEGDIGTGIIDVFDRYNFTVNENDPIEKDVAVDPEMLGKVFENLLPIIDRKSKGAFYTPREIVHFMSQESLINYLCTHLMDVPKEDIEIFIKNGKSIVENDKNAIYELQKANSKGYQYIGEYKPMLPFSIRENAKSIDDLLQEVKVCDPAVGSGAFPLGMINEIVSAREVLGIYLNNQMSAYDLKLHSISNSIYGVDIDSSAVEIAKLRLWLSLVVEEEEPHPLPNLEHKIMQGNSLLSEYEGIKLFDDSLIKGTDNNEKIKNEINDEINILSREYIDLHTNRKLTSDRQKELESRINQLRSELNKISKKQKIPTSTMELFDFENKAKIAHQKTIILQNKIKDYVSESHRSKKQSLKDDIDNLKWDLIEITLEIQKNQSKLDEIKELRKRNKKPFFIWKLEFNDVFKEKNGFDILIGNPPYLEARSSEFSAEFKNDLNKQVSKDYPQDSNLITKGCDLLVYFYLLSIKLINNSGVVVKITQNSWLDTEYGSKFQKFLLNNTWVKTIIDSDYKYFDTANINTIITIFEGNKPKFDESILFIKYKIKYENIGLYSAIKENDPNKVEIKSFSNSSDILKNYKWGILLNSNQMILNIFNKLQEKGRQLDSFLDNELKIGQGLNLSRRYVLSKTDVEKFKLKSNQLIPFITKHEISSFYLEKSDHYLIKKNNEITNILDKSDFLAFDPSSTTKISPVLIIPRGIGERHYCALNCSNGYSDSAVDIYYKGENDNRIINNLWLFFNSSLFWLLREISGRKNLGGGMLKAEAIDIKKTPLYFDFEQDDQIQEIINEIKTRLPLPVYQEIKTTEHKKIDQLVYKHLGFTETEAKKINNLLIDFVNQRTKKSKT